MVIIGIDPGASGAIAVLQPNKKIIEVVEMPTKKEQDKKASTVIDFYTLLSVLGKYKDMKPLVMIEKLHSLGGTGASSTFKFGRNYQACIDAVEAWRYPLRFVEPKVWQSHVFCNNYIPKKTSKKTGKRINDTKRRAFIAAKKVWTSEYTQDKHFYKNYVANRPDNAKFHDGKVDALLIAYWAIRNWAEKGTHPYETLPVKLKPIFDCEMPKPSFGDMVPDEA